jgi:hypothetical protein
MTSSDLEPLTFRFVAQQLNQLRYRVPRLYINLTIAIRDVIHRPVFYLKQILSETALSPSSGGTFSVGPNG